MIGTNMQITEEVLVAATSNYEHGHIILFRLLKQSVEAGAIGTTVLEGALRSRNSTIMSVLLLQRGDVISLNKDLLQGWVNNSSTSNLALKYLLQYKEIDVDTIIDTMSTTEQAEFSKRREVLFERYKRYSWDDVFEMSDL